MTKSGLEFLGNFLLSRRQHTYDLKQVKITSVFTCKNEMASIPYILLDPNNNSPLIPNLV